MHHFLTVSSRRSGSAQRAATAWPALLLAGLTWAAGAAQAQAPAAVPDELANRSLAATCANCHGTQGRALPNSGMLPLAGADRATLLRQLTEYKAGTRPATVMHQIAKGYTDEQLARLAAYFSAQKP